MERPEVLEQLTRIFIRELDNDSIRLTPETTANDIDEWDSLTHIQLIVATEKHFKIKFTSLEILGFKNVGAMADAILAKLNSK